jgi:hypothetical protein
MQNNTPNKNDVDWLQRAPSNIERSKFRLALIDYLVIEKIELDACNNKMKVLRDMVPYLSKYNKKWATVEPAELKTNTMKMVQALYDTIINEFEK